jgi:hypothetical protein
MASLQVNLQPVPDHLAGLKKRFPDGLVLEMRSSGKPVDGV